MSEPTKTVMDPQLLLDDDTEIAIDNLCWDYAGFVHSPAPERTGSERKYDIARNALRLRIAQLVEDARKEILDRAVIITFPEPTKYLGGCNCAWKAPTIPTCRDPMQHLDDCPAKNSGYPAGCSIP